MAPFDGGHAEAVLVRDKDQFFFLPYIVRPLSKIGWVGDEGAKLFDIVSPYGYPGPIQAGTEAFQRYAISTWHKVMRERGCVSGFVRMHPLLNVANSAVEANGELIERGRTVSIDLETSSEEMWRQTRENHRRDIVKQRRTGMTAAMKNDAESLDVFATIYYRDHGAGWRRQLLPVSGRVFPWTAGRVGGQHVSLHCQRRRRSGPRRRHFHRVRRHRPVPPGRNVQFRIGRPTVEAHVRLRTNVGETTRQQGVPPRRRIRRKGGLGIRL